MLSNHRFVSKITEIPTAEATCGAVLLAGTWLVCTASVLATPLPSEDVALGQIIQGQTSQLMAVAPDDIQTLYVNPELGSDRAEGVEAAPLRTITRALELAPPNTVIVLAPGRYSRASGEVFPLQLKPGVTIQGAPGSSERSAIIEGGGAFESPTRSQQNAAILAADRAGIAQVAISNADGYGVWIESASPTILETAFIGNRQTGIYVTGGSPRVQSNYFSGNQVAGLIVFGLSRANITSNTFDSTGDAIRIAEGATPEIVRNRIVNNDAGLVLIGDVAPIVRNNRISGNRRNEILRVATDSREVQPVSASLIEPTASLQPTNSPVASSPVANSPVANSPVANSPATRPQATLDSAPQMPIPADAVPSEIAGGLSMMSTSLPPTPPTQRLAAARPTSRPLITTPRRLAAQPNPPAQPISTPQSIPIEVENSPVSGEPSSHSESNGLSAGAPGAALAALQSGIALVPRAVSGENPDEPPILRRRRERLRRENENRNENGTGPDSIRRPSAPVTPLPPVNNNRVSVPSSSIPLGSGGRSNTVFSPPTGGVGGPPIPPTRAQALGLYYRVFVETGDPVEQDEVRALIRDAFRTQLDGRAAMQVGAFPTEEEAIDRQRILEENGFNAQIEYIR
ncbi:MAG: DUF1565 domain-containing protein [Cyanobacteria bacterium P01_D01_bin.105]